MSTLSDGLAARGKATKDTWYRSDGDCVQISVPFGTLRILAGPETQDVADEVLAAPDALDWVAKALPYLRGDLADQLSTIKEYPKLAAINPQWQEIATELTSLIAEAEGTEKEGGGDEMKNGYTISKTKKGTTIHLYGKAANNFVASAIKSQKIIDDNTCEENELNTDEDVLWLHRQDAAQQAGGRG